MLFLREESRGLFKVPFGCLFPDIEQAIRHISGRTVYAAGDRVSTDLVARGCMPAIVVTDGFTLRAPCPALYLPGVREIIVRNPAGCLTEELFSVVAEAVRRPPVHILVEGEEDLAVIPLVLSGTDGAALVYGQPHEGVVVCILDDRARARAQELLTHFSKGPETCHRSSADFPPS